MAAAQASANRTCLLLPACGKRKLSSVYEVGRRQPNMGIYAVKRRDKCSQTRRHMQPNKDVCAFKQGDVCSRTRQHTQSNDEIYAVKLGDRCSQCIHIQPHGHPQLMHACCSQPEVKRGVTCKQAGIRSQMVGGMQSNKGTSVVKVICRQMTRGMELDKGTYADAPWSPI